MAKITKIKASDTPRKHTEEESVITRKFYKYCTNTDLHATVILPGGCNARCSFCYDISENVDIKDYKKKLAEAKIGSEKPKKKTFILFRPFVAFFRYLRDSWRELRQVRWPNNKTTWKMLLAVLVYTLLFVVFITLLDLLFSWIFGLLLGNK